MTLGPIQNNGHVIIIGGGPGGTGCGLALQALAARMGREIRVTVLEGKRFSGEQHYNQCAGVLSPPLPQLLENDLGVPFPAHLSRGQIRDYVLHAAGRTLTLKGHGAPSVAVRRVQFDAYMLEQARQRDIRVLQARAVDIEFHVGKVHVYTEKESLVADVVVGAFGLDEGSATLFRRQTDYRPPRALSSIVTKYHPGEAGMRAIGERIHAFLPGEPRIEFAAATPKGNHLTINIAGHSVDAPLMDAFLQRPDVLAVLPNLETARTHNPRDLQYFKGRFPYTAARHYYGDRYVMVGDAAGLVRTFKGKGVTSAVLTGIRAAETILENGISRAAFHAHYRQKNLDILRDMPYGHLMRLLTINMARLGLLTPVVRAAANNADLQRALFDAVSAHAPYTEVLQRVFRPAVTAAILRQFFSPT